VVKIQDKIYGKIASSIDNDRPMYGFRNNYDKNAYINYEEIIGRHFINYDGEEVVIGYSIDTENALGLPLEAFENMTKLHKNKVESLEKNIEILNENNEKYMVLLQEKNLFKVLRHWFKVITS